jgi:hypothetical protein
MFGTTVIHLRDLKCLQNFNWKREGKRPLGRLRSRWKDNIEINLKDIICEITVSTQLIRDRIQRRAVVNWVQKLFST